jgi:hypothetical protein
VAVAAALALTAPATSPAATPQRDSVYTGKTSQGEVISFVTSRNGKRVIDLATSLTYRCSGEHDGQAGSFILDEIKIRDARFTSKQELTGTSETSVVQAGTGRAKGTFKRKGHGLNGRIRSRLTLLTGETCDSGTVTFSVSLL